MVGDQETAQARIHRYAQTCELIFEQPISYYHQQIEKQFVTEIDFSRYYVMITGLPRQVYRPAFGTDAFQYSLRFKDVEIEVVGMLEKQGVRCMTTMLLYDHTKRFCMIFNKPDSISAVDVAQITAGCFNRLNAQIFDMNKTPYRNYTVLSPEVHGYENLPGTFRELDALSRQQFFDMQTMLMTPALLQQMRICVSQEQIHESMTQLRTALRSRNAQAVENAVDETLNLLEQTRDFAHLEKALHSIRLSADGMLASYGRELEEVDAFSIGRYPTFDHLRRSVKGKLLEIIASMPDGPAMSAPVLEAVRYIRNHFTEDVALADVARHIDMSPSWLTKRFNKECSMSIPQYLLSVRMEHAKKLLSETNMLIFEVAGSVGFDNSRYFVSVFKKETGLTPTAYREQMKKA